MSLMVQRCLNHSLKSQNASSGTVQVTIVIGQLAGAVAVVVAEEGGSMEILNFPHVCSMEICKFPHVGNLIISMKAVWKFVNFHMLEM